MKSKMYSAESNTRLHKTIDEFFQSNKGIQNLHESGVVEKDEYVALVQRNIDFFFSRIKEYRIAERLVCVFFAFLFTWMQTSVDDLDMRRNSRTRAGSRVSRTHRAGKKKDVV